MKGKLLHLLCLLCLLGGMSTQVSAQYSATPVTSATQFVDGGKYAIMVGSDGKGFFVNQFIFLNTNATPANLQIEGYYNSSSGAILTKNNVNEKVSSNPTHYFVLKESNTNPGTFAIMNNDGTYWGLSTVSNTIGKIIPVTVDNATYFTLEILETGYIDIKDGNNNHVDRYNTYGGNLRCPSQDAKVKNLTHYSFFKIEENASGKYYLYDIDGNPLTESPILVDADGTTKLSDAYTFPTFLDVTYHSDKTNWTEEDPGSLVGAQDYYIKTSYKEGFPFTPSDSWTTLYNGKTFAQTGNSGDVAKYAVKIGGDWLNGFTLQRYDGTFLSTNATWGKAADAAKFSANDANNLSTTDGSKNLYLSSNGTMFLNDTKDAFSKKDLLYAYPTQKYVGSYYRGQIGSVTFDQMLAGEGKVALSADKYYYLELHNGTTDENKQLTSAGATVQVLPSAATYAFTAAASTTDNFPGLWKIADGKLTNLNAAFNLGTDITMTHQGVDGNNHGLYNIKMKATDNTDRWLYYDSGTGKVFFGYSSNYNWALREFDESTIFTMNLNEVKGTYYATLCAPIPLQATSEDFKVYTGKLADGNTVLALEEHDGVIPAGMPVMLISTESATATFQYATTLDTYTPNEAWKGTLIDLKFADEATAKNYRTLGKGGAANTAGFYTPGVTTKIPANRAYIEMPSASETQAMLPIRFDDGTLTWIDASILTGEQTDNAAIYDLSGRRIMQPQRGQLYIRGGKKFIAQ